ncbi:hypothetical protein [Sphingomonas sp.]|uniref:hypothetical protein n=1 Tax=Sphingomonas sp. TaxID=28214 RepID=UPI001ED03308|nr:hypothetical protein [Sphingomonas sp.]MBX3595871.1 hypothetical protein [Sphingomonas sp.]
MEILAPLLPVGGLAAAIGARLRAVHGRQRCHRAGIDIDARNQGALSAFKPKQDGV